MNQYLYTVQPVRRGMFDTITAQEHAALQAHNAYLDQLFAQGVVFFSGATAPQDDSYCELILYHAPDDAAAAAVVASDPAVQARILRGCWYPYRVALWNGNARLLESDQQHFLYHIQPVRPDMLTDSTPFEDETVTAHFYYLRDLTLSGTFCLVGRTLNTDYSTFGIGVLRAASAAEAEAVSEQDPAVIQRVMRLSLLPFIISRMAEAAPQ